MGDGAVPAEAAQAATMPTLVMDGGESEASFHDAAKALADALPNARYRTLEGQTHAPVDPEALAPVLAEFFAGSNGSRPKGEMS
jgi:pimeloyl-ACP methyl ester carboxylesterase